MRTFKDSKGNIWNVKVTKGVLERCKNELDVDLTDLFYEEGSKKVLGDAVMFCNVIYLVCKDQATERNIDDYQFGEAMYGDVLEEAGEALLQSIADFFPSSKRKIHEAQLAKAKEAAKLVEAKILQAINEFQPERLLKPVTDTAG